MKAIRIFLFILIIIGFVLIATKETWVPKLVNRIISNEAPFEIIKIPNKIPDGQSKNDLIRVSSPLPNQAISSPLTIEGTARGYWFFEASFPVTLVNWDGLIIAQGTARAESNWMTTDFVPFKVKLNFTVDKNSYSNKGALILRKDNPSGLPKNNDSLEIPVIFAGIAPDTLQKSGVTGTVTLGPTCPVERIPPDPNCAPRFYSTSINILRTSDDKFIKTIKSDGRGAFSVNLDPGSYILKTQGGNVLPRCPETTAEVKSGQYAVANISCDTGIR